MPKIRKITIRNFRSIADICFDVTDLTVVVGDNDSGKSNILRALNLFFNNQTNPDVGFDFLADYNKFVKAGAKRAPEIQVELYLEIPESYRENNGDYICWRKRWRADGIQDEREYWGVRFEKNKRADSFKEVKIELSKRSKVHSLLNRIHFEYVPAIRSADFFRALRGRIFHVIAHNSEQNVRNSSAQFEGVIANAVSDLLSDISSELSDSSKLRLPNDLTPIFEGLDFLSGEKSISLENRGDGIKARYIPLILKFIADQGREAGGIPATFIWAYEEPENNLEFRRAQQLADAFKRLAEGAFSQVFLTTHSPIFYNLHRQVDCARFCSAFHTTHEGSSSGTKVRSANEAEISLDQSMGAMAIIAPHILAAQEALREATLQADDLSDKLEKFNSENRPTIFLEGASDYLIYCKLIEYFFPEYQDLFFVAEPPKRAGANYVTNMLRSWEYRVKHLSAEKRTRAVGLLDCDNEGNAAKARFDSEVKNPRNVSLITLKTPIHLSPAKEVGVEIPIGIEELWPAEIWKMAKEKGWLCGRKLSGIISETLTARMIVMDEKLSEIIQGDWKIFFDNCADGSLDSHAKVDWAKSMIDMTKSEIETYASEHIETLRRAIKELRLE